MPLSVSSATLMPSRTKPISESEAAFWVEIRRQLAQLNHRIEQLVSVLIQCFFFSIFQSSLA